MARSTLPGYLTDWRGRLAGGERQLEEVRERTRTEEREARRRTLLPIAEVVEVVMRYEGHLHKQLTLTLHELERRQASPARRSLRRRWT